MIEKMALPTKLVSISVIYICIYSSYSIEAQNKSFIIDYNGNTFLKDGKPFRYISGSLHYSRVHPLYWRDRLEKMYAAGLNAVQTYVPWNLHQPEMNVFNFSGLADLEGFLKTAQDVGLLVVLRAGPYICGEWEFGGFPAWILKENPYTVFRTMDSTYIKYVDIWLDALYNKIKPLVYSNGGPVIMVQIENEYGSYYACDHEYTKHLMAKATQHFGNSVIIFTTDGDSDGDFKCGKTDGAYATVDFGVTLDPMKNFQVQRQYEPYGPLVNSEFYTGWLDHWGYPHEVRDMDAVADCLDKILKLGANVNMYMFEGGTNFGFWNGANYPRYQPVPTSYDYDAPLTEAGDITDKYLVIRQVISKYSKEPTKPIPPSTPKAAYGNVTMAFSVTIQDALSKISPGVKNTKYPPTMEEISQYQGFVLYRHVLKVNITKPTNLSAPGLKDRGYVMIDKVPLGVLKRGEITSLNITGSAGQLLDILVEIQGHITAGPGTNNDTKVPQGVLKREETVSMQITGKAGQVLDILMENCGHIGFGSGMNNESKGTGNVTLGNEILQDWLIYPISLDKFNPADKFNSDGPKYNGKLMTPSFYVGQLKIPFLPNDTYLDPTAWRKGQLFINDNNVGRYWPDIGPQIRLYIPKWFLRAQSSNPVVMFELESAPCQTPQTCYVQFVDKPLVNAKTHGPDIQKYYKERIPNNKYGVAQWKIGVGHDTKRLDYTNYFPGIKLTEK